MGCTVARIVDEKVGLTPILEKHIADHQTRGLSLQSKVQFQIRGTSSSPPSYEKLLRIWRLYDYFSLAGQSWTSHYDAEQIHDSQGLGRPIKFFNAAIPEVQMIGSTVVQMI